MNRDKEESTCCKSSFKTVGDETKHYRCDECGEACDVKKKEKLEEWEEEFDLLVGLAPPNTPKYQFKEKIKTFIKKEKEKSKLEALELAIGEEKKTTKVYNFNWEEKHNKFGNKEESPAKHYAMGQINGFNQKREQIIQIKDTLKKEITK